MKKFESIVKNKTSKKVMFAIADFIILLLSSYLALKLRFDLGPIPMHYVDEPLLSILVDAVTMYIIFIILRLYTSVWRFASVTELLNVIYGCLMIEVCSFVFHSSFGLMIPRSFHIIRLLLMIIFVGGLRFSFRIIRTLIIRYEENNRKKNTMIIGAGSAGRLLIEEICYNKDSDEKIVCVIDDNKNLKGSYFKNIPVCGGRKTIVNNAEKYNVEEIIIAMPSAPKTEISKIVDECQKTKCKINILPSIYSSLNKNDKDIAKNVRPLSYEDFLGRNQIVVNSEEITNNIKDKVVLVTGGGGSIGSELCRQVAAAEPKTLIIFDIYENNAYEIQQELFRNYPALDLHTIIGSVRDYDRLEKVFIELKPQMVFHAAAHKHVPLMEVSPNEAVKNNCLGTLNVAKLADKYKVEKFVLVSTDKAVNPTNVMGATKRICEMIVQTYDKLSKNTKYVAVRFGNVLGSNGSVIPLFLKQIEKGGPVTVTDKEMRRFFMTIPEAVNLILQASVYAEGGEIFVLDMGQPVKIYDLAEKLIRFKGYEPNVDIPIKITGLRPGEKLYEERLMDEEGMKRTPNKLISIGQPLDIPKSFLNDLDKLIKTAYKNTDEIKDEVAKIVTTYKVDKERVGK